MEVMEAETAEGFLEEPMAGSVERGVERTEVQVEEMAAALVERTEVQVEEMEAASKGVEEVESAERYALVGETEQGEGGNM